VLPSGWPPSAPRVKVQKHPSAKGATNRRIQSGIDEFSGSTPSNPCLPTRGRYGKERTVQKITPNLWFDTEAEEAANFYTSIFKDSEVVNVMYYGEAGPRPAGMVLTVTFRLQGQEFTALNGGPEFKFNEAISLLVNCESQEEVDEFWERLSEGGEEGPCGWLKDRFGVSWQIVPTVLDKLLQDEDSEKANRVMQAMLQMKKLDIAGLQAAYDG
jgi:predicted 3-demethylubiquinone-9 3-methyltransferase (glyoxalase superfamily)